MINSSFTTSELTLQAHPDVRTFMSYNSYADPFRGLPQYPGLLPYSLPYGGAHPGFTLLPMTAGLDPRARLMHEEPKPQQSYIGLISMAIISSKDCKLVLSDIYQYILDNYVYFRTRGPGWRNSIRHNLSLNDCFIKSGRSANGKGHYWAIHPACIEDFKRGDFRRRRAQRKVRKHMGLSVPDEDEDDDTPPPSNQMHWLNASIDLKEKDSSVSPNPLKRRRGFDIESLLAPDDVDNVIDLRKTTKLLCTSPIPNVTLPPATSVFTSLLNQVKLVPVHRPIPLLSLTRPNPFETK